MALTRSKKEERLGSSKYMNCGSLATIIKYQNARNMSVQFEDGTIVEKVTWQQWSKGEILNHSIKDCTWKQRLSKENGKDRIGETRMMNCGVEATIVKYNNRHDITVQFTDGSLNEHKSYGEFLCGEIQCYNVPKIHNGSKVRNLNCKEKREGLKKVMNCGMECQIIEYRNSHTKGITVQFNDGEIVISNWNNFLHHSIHNPNLPKCGCVNNSTGEQQIANALSQLSVPFVRQKTFEDLKSVKNNHMFFDFYLPNNNLLIEYQGEFHDGIPFKKNPNGIQTKQKWEEQKVRDDIKRKWAKNHNIELLEIWYYDKTRIEEILKEALCLC